VPVEGVRPLPPGARLDAVDLVRGVVMVLMALDHVRGFLGPQVDPENPATTPPGLFLTRWVTHFCAPAFVFLAGTGAFLRGTRGTGRGALAWFLLTRGLWLIVLEFTLVLWSLTFSFNYSFMVGQVILAIGASMVLLSGLVLLPASVVGLLGVTILVTHNLFDGVQGSDLGPAGWVWDLLHTRRLFEPLPGLQFFLLYPLLPWFGVLTAGYGFGVLLTGEPARRRVRLLMLGSAMTLAFVVLRCINSYGDPRPWSLQADGLRTVLAFMNCQKYPPSLQFLLMTLGPAILLLAVADWVPRAVAAPLVIFGRVPLFFYLLHFALIHAVAVGLAWLTYGQADWLIGGIPRGGPADYGYSLPVLYLMWVGCVVLLWPACRWFAGVKRRHPGGLLSYL
jgi:uncharacterized membrane protein